MWRLTEDLEDRVVLWRIRMDLVLVLPQLRRRHRGIATSRVGQRTPSSRHPTRADDIRHHQRRQNCEQFRRRLLPGASFVDLSGPALAHERGRPHPASSNLAESTEVVLDAVNSEPETGVRVRAGHREDIRVRHEADLLEDIFTRAVRNISDGGAKRDRDDSKGEGDTPLATAYAVNREGSSSDEDDKYLNGNFCKDEPA